MKTKLYFFTGTGNSLKISRDLAAKLGETEIIPIAKVVNSEKIEIDSDFAGIVFPVYMWGMPLIVKRFAEKISVSPNTYLFSVINYGGWQGGTTHQLKGILAKKGLKLSASLGIKMPGNYLPMYGAIDENKQQKMFNDETEKLNYIVDCIKNKKHIIETDSIIVKWFFYDFIYKFSSPHINKMDKSYFADEKCNACKICEQICPVKNIVMENKKQKWLGKCEQCVACIQWCPAQAIQYGKSTAAKKRYHCPGITVKDLM
jgi:ferredoxin